MESSGSTIRGPAHGFRDRESGLLHPEGNVAADRIVNPNPEDIRIVRIAILKPDAEMKGQETPLIRKGQTTTIGVACYFNKSSLGQEELILQCIFEIAGEERVMEMKVAAEFKSALTGGFSLKDLK